MAAVILEKIAQQLRVSPTADRAAEQRDLTLLLDDLDVMAVEPDLVSRGPHDRATIAGLDALVAGLYARQSDLEPEAFDVALARVRTVLRADIDRRIEVAG